MHTVAPAALRSQAAAPSGRQRRRRRMQLTDAGAARALPPRRSPPPRAARGAAASTSDGGDDKDEIASLRAQIARLNAETAAMQRRTAEHVAARVRAQAAEAAARAQAAEHAAARVRAQAAGAAARAQAEDAAARARAQAAEAAARARAEDAAARAWAHADVMARLRRETDDARAAQRAAEDARAALRAMEAARARAELNAFLDFFYCVAGMASDFSDTDPGDEPRRGVPPLALAVLPHVLRAPAASPAAASGDQEAWERLRRAALSPACTWLRPLKRRDREAAAVHPAVHEVLLAALPEDADLQVFRGKVGAASAGRGTRPDFTLTHARDGAANSFGALLIAEVGMPGRMDAALRLAAQYGRMRLLWLVREAIRRGEVDSLHGLSAFVAATDGCSVVLVRIDSGAPTAGGSFANATPCVAWKSDALPLLCDWHARGASALPAAAPEGFLALRQLLRGGAAGLGAAGLPLREVRAELRSAAGAGASEAPYEARIALDSRLGSGGSCDAYGIAAADGVEGGAVLKLPRWASAAQLKHLEGEAETLLALRGAPGVPRLLYTGDALGPAFPRGDSARWPLLVLQPRGRPLRDALADAGAAAGRSTAATRRAFAAGVLASVQRALQAAHAAGIVHCDVRPQNVVAAGGAAVGAAVLVDWGAARKRGDEAAFVGVPAYVASRVFLKSSCAATESLDLFGAALLWVCIVYGARCEAPWASPRRTDWAVLDARDLWLERRAKKDAAVAAVCDRLQMLREADGPLAAAEYEWTPPV